MEKSLWRATETAQPTTNANCLIKQATDVMEQKHITTLCPVRIPNPKKLDCFVGRYQYGGPLSSPRTTSFPLLL